MPHLQRFYEEHQSKGLVILGFNWADERTIVLELLREHGITFPNIVDGSEAAWNVVFTGLRASGVPLHCLIDRDGKVVDIWYGWDEARALRALEALGVG